MFIYLRATLTKIRAGEQNRYLNHDGRKLSNYSRSVLHPGWHYIQPSSFFPRHHTHQLLHATKPALTASKETSWTVSLLKIRIRGQAHVKGQSGKAVTVSTVLMSDHARPSPRRARPVQSGIGSHRPESVLHQKGQKWHF